MITHWPEIGDTETLYSIACRLQYLHGMGSSAQASRLLFGFQTASSLRFNARNLDFFCRLISDRLGSAEEILRYRTPVGQFAPYIDRSQWKHMVEWCSKPPSAVKPFTALWASPSFPDIFNNMMCSGEFNDEDKKELHGRVQA